MPHPPNRGAYVMWHMPRHRLWGHVWCGICHITCPPRSVMWHMPPLLNGAGHMGRGICHITYHGGQVGVAYATPAEQGGICDVAYATSPTVGACVVWHFGGFVWHMPHQHTHLSMVVWHMPRTLWHMPHKSPQNPRQSHTCVAYATFATYITMRQPPVLDKMWHMPHKSSIVAK